jgi:signal transduction histidine kinase
VEYFFSTYNPLFFILITAIFIVTILYLVITKFLVPMQKMHRYEKSLLELQNEKMKALFTQFSPSPVFRFDKAGKLVLTNNAGYAVFGKSDPVGRNLRDLIPALKKFDLEKIITDLEEHTLDASILDREYSITLKGVPEVGFGHLYCFDITERILYERELEFTRSKLRELALHLQDLRESDRNAVAMELHDNICQRLSSVRLTIENIDNQQAMEGNERMQLDEITHIVDDLIVDTRELSYTLKPRFLGEFGLVPAVKTLVEQTISKSSIQGVFNHYGFEQRLDPKLETYIYRIIQELLNNIMKHSGASKFIVQIFRDAHSIKVLVQDNGKGVDKDLLAQKQGLGLVNIRERIETFNGSFSFESEKNKGTEFIIELPAA